MILILQLNPVQTFLAKEVVEIFSEQTDHEISLDKVKISWLDQAVLEKALVRDLEGDTLIYSQKLEINYQLWDILSQDFLEIEEINSEDIILRLVKYEEGAKLNFTLFLNSFKSKDKKKEKKPIEIDQINLSKLHLGLKDLSKEPDMTKLDFGNLDFNFSDLILSDFALKSDTIFGRLVQLKGQEDNSNFTIEEFATVFRVSNSSLSVDDLNFKTPTSQVSDSLEFFYSGLDDLGNFKDSVSFILHFNDTRISKEDLKIITGTNKLESDITLDGIIWGTVGDFNIEETRIGYGSSYFVGGVSCFGLPNLKKTFILADITDSHVLPRDLRPYIGSYTDNLRQMGRIDFRGSFAGFLDDFVARGDFVTDQGSVHSDINLKIPDDPNMMSYDGNLEFRKVNIGAFFKNNIVQVVSFKASIKGKGLKPENAAFDLNATVYQSGLYGYVYDTVRANGAFAENFFEGTFSVDDQNCNLNGKAQIDFRGSKEILNVDVDVDTFNADTLNFTERQISGKGVISLHAQNLNIDDFTGYLSVDSAELKLEGKRVVIDSVRFIADLVDQKRILKLSLPGVESEIEGEFRISDALKDIKLMSQDYASRLMLINDDFEVEKSGNSYKLNMTTEIRNIKPYLDSLGIPIYLSGATKIEGSFRQSKNSNISLFVESDSLVISGNAILNPVLELNGSEDIESSSILTNFIFQSDDQRLKGVSDTRNLLLEGVWNEDVIDLTTIVDQPDTESELRLKSRINIARDSLVLSVLPSSMRLLGDIWEFEEMNKIIVSSDKVTIKNFEIYDATESINIEGVYADSISTSLVITAKNLKMNKVELVTDASIGGFLNGTFKMFRETGSMPFRFDGGFELKELSYDELPIGDVIGKSNWDPKTESIYTKVDVKRENVNTINVEGYYYPSREQNLDFDITFDEANLVMGQPFLVENLSNISGYANGSLKVTGSSSNPKVVGSCKVQDGGVLINYLGTYYNFEGKVDFDANSIKLSRVDLTDRKGSSASVSGIIRHSKFKNVILDIDVNANSFEFLNTTSVDNKLYYGSAYGTGKIDVTGPINDLNIAASIRTEANTKIFIPISDGTSIGQEDYISFVDFSDTTRNDQEEDFTISGLTLDFDIEVTPDAYCELIFDIKTGDIIRGRGRGNIKLKLDTDGEFNMFGPLEITEGAYNFTVPNFINKEFQVIPGSMITWYGDAYNAILDLDASYVQRASFEELNSDEQDQDQVTNKVPILVILRLEGGLLSPDITFDLEFQNPSDATPETTAILAQVKSDEQNLKRQVISLLFLKRFSSQNFRLGGGGTVGNSVSEFLSSQVSYLVSQIDENLEVEVDLADLNRDAFNTFQLRFAYTFLDGRLKVTRGGDFGDQNDNNDNVLNDIVGDWSVEYSLTRDGRLRAKAFRNTSQRIPVNDNQQNQETGISLRYVHSFNDFAELLSLKRDEAILRREEEDAQVEDTTSDSTKQETN